MCIFFRRAAPFVEHLQNYTEEKDQIIVFTCCLVVTHGVKFKQNKCVLFINNRLQCNKKTQNLRKNYVTNTMSFNIVKHTTLQSWNINKSL